MNENIENGFKKEMDGVTRVYYEGYWIKYYEAPVNNLAKKKLLIQSLTRRLFNHMEHGINIPGRFLDTVRIAYEAEQDARKKRVKGAMLAGALFNRAADIFNSLVELEACGVEILPENDLMHKCGMCLREALEYGALVKHRNGDEGIDELWGEPFKAFIMSIDDFYDSRYLKIALTMKNIDEVASYMVACLKGDERYEGLESLVLDYAKVARIKCETLRTDAGIYDVWAEFVVVGEEIHHFSPKAVDSALPDTQIDPLDIKHLLDAGVKLIAFITRARTPIPKSTENFMKECQRYKTRACSI
jgi:hypothetical protein